MFQSKEIIMHTPHVNQGRDMIGESFPLGQKLFDISEFGLRGKLPEAAQNKCRNGYFSN